LMEKKMRVVSPKLEGNKKLGQQKGSKCHFWLKIYYHATFKGYCHR
jgi:hypothetical protein